MVTPKNYYSSRPPSGLQVTRVFDKKIGPESHDVIRRKKESSNVVPQAHAVGLSPIPLCLKRWDSFRKVRCIGIRKNLHPSICS